MPIVRRSPHPPQAVPLPRWGRLISRIAHFVLKFLIQTFFKKFGRVWGGAPSVGIFFWSFSFVPSWFKRKAAKWDGLFRENGLLFGERSPHPPQAVPLPRWGRLISRSAHFVLKFLDPNFFQKVWRGLGRSPKKSAFLFCQAFFLRLWCQRKKRLNAMGLQGKTK